MHARCRNEGPMRGGGPQPWAHRGACGRQQRRGQSGRARGLLREREVGESLFWRLCLQARLHHRARLRSPDLLRSGVLGLPERHLCQHTRGTWIVRGQRVRPRAVRASRRAVGTVGDVHELRAGPVFCRRGCQQLWVYGGRDWRYCICWGACHHTLCLGCPAPRASVALEAAGRAISGRLSNVAKLLPTRLRLLHRAV